MTQHPTDDELEVMAVKLEQIGWRPSGERDDAAAMLRACKGRVSVKALEWDKHPDAGYDPECNEHYGGGQNNLAGVNEYNIFPHPCALGMFVLDVMGNRVEDDFPSVEAAKAAAQADYEARILAALDHAPGYLEGWNDAPEAAANACENISGLGFVDVSAIGPMPIDQIIRALKKGPTNE